MYRQHFGLRHAPLGKELTTLWDDGVILHLAERFNWLLLMVLVLVSAGLFGAMLERRRRHRRTDGAKESD